MFFILSKREPRRAGRNFSVWTQLGIVIAETPDEAVKKLGLAETERLKRDDGKFPGIFISLKDGKGNEYHLESVKEITSLITT